MDGAVQQVGNGTASQQSSSHLHPSKHTGYGKIILSWTWYCPWVALCQEYPKHEIYIASDYKISCSILAWFSRLMEATAHGRDISPANLIGECRCWTAWYWCSIEINLPLGINHSGRLHSWESKSCHHILIQWVGTATCRLDRDDEGDVSWSWGSRQFDTKAKQHVCLIASQWDDINWHMQHCSIDTIDSHQPHLWHLHREGNVGKEFKNSGR